METTDQGSAPTSAAVRAAGGSTLTFTFGPLAHPERWILDVHCTEVTTTPPGAEPSSGTLPLEAIRTDKKAGPLVSGRVAKPGGGNQPTRLIVFAAVLVDSRTRFVHGVCSLKAASQAGS